MFSFCILKKNVSQPVILKRSEFGSRGRNFESKERKERSWCGILGICIRHKHNVEKIAKWQFTAGDQLMKPRITRWGVTYFITVYFSINSWYMVVRCTNRKFTERFEAHFSTLNHERQRQGRTKQIIIPRLFHLIRTM